MAKKAVETKVAGFKAIPWSELKTYEFNDLKQRGPGDVVRLKNAIINDGFCFPIEVWAGHRYVIDGRGRDIALRQLEAEGYSIPDLPIVEISASSKDAAKRLVLMRTSVHGKLTQESYDRFMDGVEVKNLDLMVSIPGIDVGVAGSSLGDAEKIGESFESIEADEESGGEEDEDGVFFARCPVCAHDFALNPSNCWDSNTVDGPDPDWSPESDDA